MYVSIDYPVDMPLRELFAAHGALKEPRALCQKCLHVRNREALLDGHLRREQQKSKQKAYNSCGGGGRGQHVAIVEVGGAGGRYLSN